MSGHVRQRGQKGQWYAVFDVTDPVSGKRKRRWHKLDNCKGKREAEKKCEKLIALRDEGTYVERSNQTVGTFVKARVDQWEANGDVSARSAARYGGLLKKQIAPHLGSVPLQKLSHLQLEAWHTTLRNSGIAARTIGFAHRLLGRALKDALRDGAIGKNVCQVAHVPRVVERETVIVTDVPGFIEKIRGEPIYPMAILALLGGLRLGEVLALRWENVDLDTCVLHVREALEHTVVHGIRFKAPKSRAGRRTITLPDVVLDVLRDHRRAVLEMRLQLGLGKLPADALLFGNIDGEPQRTSVVSTQWARLAQRIGLPEITFHALRHTHASMLIASGLDIVTVSKRMGHANPTITLQTYAHLFATDDRKAAAAINEALRG